MGHWATVPSELGEGMVNQINVLNAIKRIMTNAAGNDYVSVEMLKLCLPTILDQVTLIIDCFIEVG